MKRITYIEGQYSQIKLDDGSRVFVEILPERVRAKKMILGVIPTKTLWEFIFPFYIRTAIEAWDSSKVILNIVLETMKNVKDLGELKSILESETSKALQGYIKEHGEDARDVSVNKVGIHALKQMLKARGLQTTENILHEFGKILEKTGQETMFKYPAGVYPQSLLPYPKEEIRKALYETKQFASDEKIKEQIKIGEALLDTFIDDEEAKKKNNELLKLLSDAEHILKHNQDKLR